jgi:molybdopterin/thiamine biosynthesis adenylyltransferase
MKTFIHEEVYRTEKLLRAMASTNVTVCGCGAIGSNLIDNMCRQGFAFLTVIDMDRIEDHNRSTQIWDRPEIGLLKADTMKRRAYNSTGATITPFAKELTGENVKKLLRGSPLVVDSFDNSKSRQIIYDHCKGAKIECLHVGLYRDYAEVIWNDSYLVPKDTGALDVCEYPLARNVILLSVAVATESIIRFIQDGSKQSFTITLKDLKINRKED